MFGGISWSWIHAHSVIQQLLFQVVPNKKAPKVLFENIHSHISHNSQILETTQMPVDSRKGK